MLEVSELALDRSAFGVKLAILGDMAEDERANGAPQKAAAIERRIAVLEAGLRRTLMAEGRWP